MKAVLRDEDELLPITRVHAGGVAFSMPTILASDGGRVVLEPLLNTVEKDALQHSVEVLRKAYESIGS